MAFLKFPMFKKISCMWEMDESLGTVKALEIYLSDKGWHVAMAGGVLHRGYSSHDLDLVLFPRDSTQYNIQELYKALAEYGWRLFRDSDTMHRYWKEKGGKDEKLVTVWTDEKGRRIDVILGVLK